MTCERQGSDKGEWLCHRCESMWYGELAKTDWLPSTCPNYKGCSDPAQQTPEPLREALEFYADPTRYSGPNQRFEGDPDKYQPEGLYYRLDATRDGGSIARRALALSSAHCGSGK